MRIAYLANQFPSSIEPYVMDEINALRNHGIEVLPCSARRVLDLPAELNVWKRETLCLQHLRIRLLLRSAIKCCISVQTLAPFLRRALFGPEKLGQRCRALIHTYLGVYYALQLQQRRVRHIHIHHGYFSAWIGMIAARVLGISYSLTLHGSDLLCHSAFLDTKLEHCSLCFTVSDYNRQFVYRHFPFVPRRKIVLRRLGVNVPPVAAGLLNGDHYRDRQFLVLAVGRLHAVKDHVFLIRACALLKCRGFRFTCFIAGDGPEKEKLKKQIKALRLEREVKLLGHVCHQDLEAIYPMVDAVVLTSKSEGIPVVLMEAMAHGVPVLAPRITGIPELVVDGETGFLYAPASMEDFVNRFELVHASYNALGPLRRAARECVRTHFNRAVNDRIFVNELCDRLLRRTARENTVLQ